MYDAAIASSYWLLRYQQRNNTFEQYTFLAKSWTYIIDSYLICEYTRSTYVCNSSYYVPNLKRMIAALRVGLF